MYKIREILEKDNSAIEKIIRDCLTEYGANHEGTAWADPNLGRFSYIYNSDGNKYWVITDENDKVVGGVGIGRLTDEICELQKMYLISDARGSGIAYDIVSLALQYAAKYYKYCYLETLDNMKRAIKFYEKIGFSRTFDDIFETGHYSCDVRMIKTL